MLAMRWQGQLLATALEKRRYRSLCTGTSLPEIFDHFLPDNTVKTTDVIFLDIGYK